VIVHGVVATPFDARHVAESVIPLTTTLVEVNALTSAIPPGTASELISTMRKRSRVTFAPVLFTKRRRTVSVPAAAFGPVAIVSRRRLGGAGAPIFESISSVVIVELRSNGFAKFSGPGAPRRWPAGVDVAAVSAKTKSLALSFVSATKPLVGHGPNVAGAFTEEIADSTGVAAEAGSIQARHRREITQ
jgi:hypothetical protein